MPKVELSSQIARHVDCPDEITVEISSQSDVLGEVLEGVFSNHAKLRDYILDEAGLVQKHITIFVDGNMLPRDQWEKAPVTNATEIFLMQAVAGG